MKVIQEESTFYGHIILIFLLAPLIASILLNLVFSFGGIVMVVVYAACGVPCCVAVVTILFLRKKVAEVFVFASVWAYAITAYIWLASLHYFLDGGEWQSVVAFGMGIFAAIIVFFVVILASMLVCYFCGKRISVKES